MSNVVFTPYGAVAVINRGRTAPAWGPTSVGAFRLPTDSIGFFALTLTNLIVGSAVRIEILSTGALVEFRVATLTSELFTIPAYGVGNALNDLRVKVRKATVAPLYKPFETITIAVSGAQSVYIGQILD